MIIEVPKKDVGLIYPKECFIINKICFEVQNELGTIYREKDYQKFIAHKFVLNKIPHRREVPLELRTKDGFSLAKFFADFILWNKIVLELKTVNQLKPDYVKQVLRYLEIADLKLALIYNFRYYPLKSKRIINFKAC